MTHQPKLVIMREKLPKLPDEVTTWVTSLSTMKFLFIIAHGDTTESSHAHVLAKSAQETLTAAGHEVRVVDLVKTTFKQCASPADFLKVPEGEKFSYGALQSRDNLSPEIREQQENLLWCTHLIVIGPMWFYKYPACFYAWTERVWTGGWAWDFSKKREELALFGRKALLVMTTGGPSEYYSHGGMSSLDGLMYTTTFGMNGCGMTVLRSQGIWAASHLSAEQFQVEVEKFGKALLNIEKRPALPFNDPQRPKDVDELEVFVKLPNLSLDDAIAA